jgi:hypothetical protein
MGAAVRDLFLENLAKARIQQAVEEGPLGPQRSEGEVVQQVMQFIDYKSEYKFRLREAGDNIEAIRSAHDVMARKFPTMRQEGLVVLFIPMVSSVRKRGEKFEGFKLPERELLDPRSNVGQDRLFQLVKGATREAIQRQIIQQALPFRVVGEVAVGERLRKSDAQSRPLLGIEAYVQVEPNLSSIDDYRFAQGNFDTTV